MHSTAAVGAICPLLCPRHLEQRVARAALQEYLLDARRKESIPIACLEASSFVRQRRPLQTRKVSLDSCVLPSLAPGDQPELWEREVAAWRFATPTSR